MESTIIGIIVVVGFVAVIGYAMFRNRKFETVKADLLAQIEVLKTRYNDLRK